MSCGCVQAFTPGTKKVENLAAALNEPGTAAEAGGIMPGLIDHIVLTPADGIVKL
jgi:hypothetical protein